MNLTDEQCISLVTGKGTWHTDDCNHVIPSIHLSDGPNGLRSQDENASSNNDSKTATCFPTESAIASGWDIQAISDMASAIASEALLDDVSVLLGPGVNIKRSPLCGRNFEYLSEDPYLSGVLAAAYIKAVQSKGIAASLKHFAGNSQETHRQTQNSEIDERALREIYLAAFEIAVKDAAPATIMASYNRLNGKYSCENKRLLTEILRKEWDYQGAVVSDWGACTNLSASLEAGMDLEMPDSLGVHTALLKRDLQTGRLSMSTLRQAADRVLTLIRLYHPDAAARKQALGEISLCKEDLLKTDHELARRLSAGSAVLLKNDGILPLNSRHLKIAVIGALAEDMRFQGGGSSHINPGTVISAVSALKDKGYQIRFEKGYNTVPDIPDETLSERAVSLAGVSDVVLFFGGLTDRSEGEGYDRKTLSLPANQLALIHELTTANKPIVFISFGGAPFAMPFCNDMSAILHMYLGGEAVGEAVCDLISGDVNPSGKLAETFPLSEKDIPCIHNFAAGSDDVEYRESIFVGYRYYDTFHIPVQYPFGFGLSYTKFEYSDLTVSCRNPYTGGNASVRFRIKNSGSCPGAEIAQLYIKNPVCSYPRAAKELRGFTKISLKPGETKECEIILNDRSFSIYDTDTKCFVMPTGTYGILIGSSSQDIRLAAELSVSGKEIIKDERQRLPSYFSKKVQAVPEEEFARLYGKPLSHFDITEPGCFTVRHSLAVLSRHSLLARMILRFALNEAYRMFPGKPPGDPEVRMTVSAITEGTVDSISLQSGGALPYKIVNAMVLSANGHHLQALWKLISKDSSSEIIQEVLHEKKRN